MTLDEIGSPTDNAKRVSMDEYIRKRYGYSHSPPDNWINRIINIGDLIQHEDNESPNYVNSSEIPYNELYE